jgi:hypothetical protein
MALLAGLSVLLYGQAKPLDFELDTTKPRSINIVLYRGSPAAASGPANISIPEEISGVPVRTIGRGAFWFKGLTGVEFPKTGRISSIGDEAFADNALAAAALPDSLKYIGAGAFRNNQLNGINIPRDIRAIGARAFENNRLAYLFPGEAASMALRSIGDWAFHQNYLSNHLDLSVFANLRTIGNGAFAENELVKVTLPRGLRSIGENAFRDNPDLRTIRIYGNVSLAVSAVDASFFYAYNTGGKRAGIYNKDGNGSWTPDFLSTWPRRK